MLSAISTDVVNEGGEKCTTWELLCADDHILKGMIHEG